MGKTIRGNTQDFIVKSKLIHGNKYIYSKVNYINSITKVIIICKIHGEFLQSPSKHLNCRHGCQLCGGSAKLNLNTFIEKAKLIHGNKYDYSLSIYVNFTTKLCIKCRYGHTFY
jgi:hypothetical protein